MLARDLGTKRGNGAGSFVSETQRQTVDFYRSVVQHLRSWRPPAPKLAVEEAEAAADVDSVPPAAVEPSGLDASTSGDAVGAEDLDRP